MVAKLKLNELLGYFRSEPSRRPTIGILVGVKSFY